MVNGGKMKRYFLKNKIRLFFTILLSVISSAIGVLIAFLLSGMVNAAANGGLQLLKNYLLFAVFYLFVVIILGRICNCLQGDLTKRIIYDMKKDIFQSIMKRSYQKFNMIQAGEYISVLSNDIDVVEDSYINSIYLLTNTVTAIVAAIISLAYIDFKIIIFACMVGAVYIVITSLLSKNISTYKDEWMLSLELYITRVKEQLSGFEVIKGFNLYGLMDKSYQNICERNCEKKRILVTKMDNLNLMNLVLGQGLIISIVFICSLLVVVEELMIGELIAIAQLMTSIISPLGGIASCINDMKSSENIKNRLISIVNESDSEGLIESAKPEISFTESIVFDHVSYSYDGKKDVLSDISLKFEKGKKYAIVGESGSGKSTLCKLLLDYYTDFKGNMYIDDVNYSCIQPEDLAEIFSVTHQDVFLFDGTLRDNITLFQDYSDEKIRQAVNFAGLKKFFEKNGNRPDTVIMENGFRLSGGEKQRIAIARALLMRQDILILDEATSSLDQNNASTIMRNILTQPEITCIVITHKLEQEDKSLYDQILEIKDGKIVSNPKKYKK